MTEDTDDIELIHGSGNIFRDFGHPNSEALQLKTVLAAKIIGALDDQQITIRQAEAMTGIAASDFSRIRKAKLSRFTIDRLMAVLGKLNQDIEVTVTTRLSRPKAVHKVSAPASI